MSICAVAGMGGVGKTELATQYARTHEADYSGGICWLNARETNLAAQIIQLAQLYLNLEVPQKDFRDNPLSLKEQVQWCWQHWQPPEGRVLVVLDDVTGLGSCRGLLPTVNRFRVLVTTRLRRIDTNFVEISLDLLPADKALELLIDLVGERDRRVQQEPQIAEKLCKGLGYLPLGLELVGRYLAEDPDLSLAEMLKRLKAQPIEDEAIDPDEEQLQDTQMTAERGVRAAFELTWQELDSSTRDVAQLLSLFSPDVILWDLVKSTAEQMNWAKRLVDTGRKQLHKYHLIQQVDKGCYKVHPLIWKFIRTKLIVSGQTYDFQLAFAKAMASIAENDPVRVTEILREGLLDWSLPKETSLSPSLEFGRQVRTAMQAWVNSIDLLARLIAPVQEDSTLPSLGAFVGKRQLETDPESDIKIDDMWSETAWCFGNDTLDHVFELPVGFQDSEMRSSLISCHYKGASTRQQPPSAWRWTHEDLVHSLSFLLQTRRLPIDEGLLVREGAWQAAFFLTGRYSPRFASLDPISLTEIERCLSQFQNPHKLLGKGVDQQRLNQLKLEMERLHRAGETELPYPWLNRVSLSPEQALSHAIDVYTGALKEYQQLVNKWFPKFSPRLQTATLLPARITGVVVRSSTSNRVAGVSWYWEALHPGSESEVKFNLSHRPISGDDPCFRAAFEQLRSLRPEVRTIALRKGDLTMFNFNPVTDLVYSWLWQDLEKVGWVKGRLGGSGLYQEAI